MPSCYPKAFASRAGVATHHVRNLTTSRGSENQPKKILKETGRVKRKKQETFRNQFITCPDFPSATTTLSLHSNHVREDDHLNGGRGGVHGTTGSPAVRNHSPNVRPNESAHGKSLLDLRSWIVAVVVVLINDDLAYGSSLLRVIVEW
jgi:hypothetical protein